MKAVVLRRTVADRRRWSLGWSFGVLTLIGLEIGFWPVFEDRADDMNKIIDAMPDSVKALFGMGAGVDAFSPIGYLSSRVYAFLVPLLLLIAGLGLAAAVAGDEEHGLLETAYSLPITRRRLVLERWVAMVVLTGLLVAVTLAGVMMAATLTGMGVPLRSMAWASLGAALLTWAFAGIGLAVAALTGRRGVALAVSAATAVAMYVVTGLAEAGIGFFQHVENVSLWTHYDVLATLRDGRPPWTHLVLAGVAAAGPLVALWGIDRRDLRAG